MQSYRPSSSNLSRNQGMVDSLKAALGISNYLVYILYARGEHLSSIPMRADILFELSVLTPFPRVQELNIGNNFIVKFHNNNYH